MSGPMRRSSSTEVPAVRLFHSSVYVALNGLRSIGSARESAGTAAATMARQASHESRSRIVFLDERCCERFSIEVHLSSAPFDATRGDERAHMRVDDVFERMNPR